MKPSALLLAAMVAAGLFGAPAASAAPCRGQVLNLRTIYLEAETSKKVVHPGEKFTVTITASRPAHEDPFNEGIEFEPPASVPASNVNAGITMWVGKSTSIWNLGVTDENGKLTLPLKFPRYAEKGKVYAAVSAYYWIRQDCPDIREDGFREYPGFMTVKP